MASTVQIVAAFAVAVALLQVHRNCGIIMAANGYVLDGNRVDAAASRVVTSLRIGNAIGNGCYHNGTVFHDGSIVPTVEPCLQCKCRDRNLVCSLRICTDLPVPPPRGCVLVQKRGVCCAYVTCSKFHKLNEIAQRRGDGHAISRRGGLGMPGGNALFRGVEEDAHAVEGNEKLCVVNGTIYRSGSAMTSSSLCSYCYCIAGRQKCVQPKCLLASPGCQPIYSDSTCCPIRYDCTKRLSTSMNINDIGSSGGSSRNALGGANVQLTDDASSRPDKPHTVHHSNKHYLRSKLRTQRSRGCIVGAHFYPEGLKLPNEPQNPCNICFCIRGAQKCTPKKCSPAIPNCRPVIPDGQCCPASYECDHSADKAPPNKSRQFDFFSMFFDADEAENGTAPANKTKDWNQTGAMPSVAASTISNTSATDSIFAAIEAGLKYIENNDDKVGTLLDGTVTNSTQVKPVTAVTPKPVVSGPTSTTTEKELSFLDIFLGEDDEDDAPSLIVRQNQTKTTSPTQTTSAEVQNEQSTTPRIEETTFIITKYAIEHTTIDVVDTSTSSENDSSDEYSTQTDVFSESTTDLSTTTDQETDDQMSETTTNMKETTDSETTTNDNESTDTSTTNEGETTPAETSTSAELSPKSESIQSISNTHSTVAPTPIPTTIPTTTSSQLPDLKSNVTPQQNLTVLPPMRRPTTTPAPRIPDHSQQSHNNHQKITTTTENIFSAFFDGISSIFNEPNSTAANGLNKLYKIRVNTDPNGTHRPTLVSQTIGTFGDGAYTSRRNQTATAPIPIKSRPTPIPFLSSSTVTPLVFNSNPSILESDLSYDYGEPTLPPSLPNLKIIPFLPTDAVKTNRNHLNYGYYNTLPSISADTSPAIDDSSYSFPGESQPVLSIDQLNLPKESKLSLDSNEYELFHVGAQMSGPVGLTSADNRYHHHASLPVPSLTNDDYVHKSYPAITESIYDLNDPTRFDTDTQKKLYAGLQTRTTAGLHDIVTGYEKYATAYPDKLDFGALSAGHDRVNQFSPPSETEGGFLPKDTLEDPYLYDSYHKTKPMMELTTKVPTIINHSEGKINNFPNSVHSDSDVFSLTRTSASDESVEDLDHDYSSIVLPDIEEDDGKNIISITTDSTYNSTSEYADASSGEQRTRPVHISAETTDNRLQSLTSLFPSVLSTQTPFTNADKHSQSTPQATTRPPSSTTPADLFGSLFGFLFKDDEQLAEFQRYDETTTVPPFRKITSLVSLQDILNHTQSSTVTMPKKTTENIPQRINDKLFDDLTTSTEFLDTVSTPTFAASSAENMDQSETTISSSGSHYSFSTSPTTDLFISTTHIDTDNAPTHPNLNILRDALLGQLGNNGDTLQSRHPIYQGSPPPFLSPIFQAQQPEDQPPASNHDHHHIRGNLDLILSGLPKAAPTLSAALPEYSSAPKRHDIVADPVVVRSTVQTFDSAAQIFTKPSTVQTTSSGSGPVGMLKLAGCNIYGRMYRVGRIIAELSTECLECRCTEVGVNCTPLEC